MLVTVIIPTAMGISADLAIDVTAATSVPASAV